MATLNKETGRRVYARMKEDGASLVHIQNVLQEVFNHAGEEEILLFLAECISAEQSDRLVIPKRRASSDRLLSERREPTSGCTSSSTRSSC